MLHCVSVVVQYLYWHFWILSIALGAGLYSKAIPLYSCNNFFRVWKKKTTSPMQVNFTAPVFIWFYISILLCSGTHSNQDSLLILLKMKLQILSNLDEMTTNSGGNWEQVTSVSRSWCPLAGLKIFHELMKRRDHVQGERSNKTPMREATDTPEQFILFPKSSQMLVGSWPKALYFFSCRLRSGLLLVGVPALESKGFISASVFGSAH